MAEAKIVLTLTGGEAWDLVYALEYEGTSTASHVTEVLRQLLRST